MARRARATDRLSQARVEDFVRIRLDGAEFWDLREFVREKEQEPGSNWHLAPDAQPLSDTQIQRYREKADRLIRESVAGKRRELVKEHVARRRNLYAKSVLAGDLRTALASAQDEAKLLGLYPVEKKKLQHSGPDGGPIAFVEIHRGPPSPDPASAEAGRRVRAADQPPSRATAGAGQQKT